MSGKDKSNDSCDYGNKSDGNAIYRTVLVLYMRQKNRKNRHESYLDQIEYNERNAQPI